MQSADRFGPLKGLCPYKALIGLTQATGLAGGFDLDIWLCSFLSTQEVERQSDDKADGGRAEPEQAQLGQGKGFVQHLQDPV